MLTFHIFRSKFVGFCFINCFMMSHVLSCWNSVTSLDCTQDKIPSRFSLDSSHVCLKQQTSHMCHMWQWAQADLKQSQVADVARTFAKDKSCFYFAAWRNWGCRPPVIVKVLASSLHILYKSRWILSFSWIQHSSLMFSRAVLLVA